MYEQVFAQAGGKRGILDLPVTTRTRRLAILELKAAENPDLPLPIPFTRDRSNPCRVSRELAERLASCDAPVIPARSRLKLPNFLPLAFRGIRCRIEFTTGFGKGLVSFSVNVRQAEKASLVELKGRLTWFETRAFREMMNSLMKDGHTNFVLNLTELDYLDSSGVGELARNYLSIVKKGGVMKVVGLAPRVEEILKVTQLYRVFPEFPDEASALESFPENGGHASA